MPKDVGTQTIDTERLILRRFEKGDAVPMFRNWASDPEVTRFLTWPTHENEEETETILASWIREYSRDDYYQWAMVLKETGEPIGSIAAVNLDRRTESAEIGYCMGKNWWRKGLMAEALTAVIEYMVSKAGYNRIVARHDVNNGASGAVMKKAGMKFEGVNRSAGKNNTGICDLAVYRVLRSDVLCRTELSILCRSNDCL